MDSINTYPLGPNFCLFRFTTSGFEDIAQFLIDYHVKRQKNKNAKNSKLQIPLFINMVPC